MKARVGTYSINDIHSKCRAKLNEINVDEITSVPPFIALNIIRTLHWLPFIDLT